MQIPDFHLHELLAAVHGYEMDSAPGDSFYCECPWHNHDSSRPLRVWANGERSSPSRDGYVCHYGEKGNTWDYLQSVHDLPPPGEPGFEDTVRFICDQLGTSVRSSGGSPGDSSLSSRAYQLIKEISGRLHPIQFTDQNEHYAYNHEAEQWLYRGLPPMQWLGRDVGMLSENDLRELESEFSEEVFSAAGLSKWNGGIGYDWLLEGVVIMFNTRHGTPAGLGVRRYEERSSFSGAPDPKYVKVGSGSKTIDYSDYVFGMEVLSERRLTETPVLYVVEGEFDCLSLQMRGLSHCVSIGSGLPTERQIDRIDQLGREPVYIADSDVNGAGSEHALRLANQWPEAQFLFLPETDTDPDEYAQSYGAEAIEEVAPHTSLQVKMMGQPEYTQGEGWTQYPHELAQIYLEELAERPSAYDEINVRTIARFSGLSEDYLYDALIRKRNHRDIDRLHQSEAAHTISVQPN
jgi:DNA primase